MSDLPERLNLNSHSPLMDKIAEILRLVPEIRTEGGKIDFEKLKSILGESVDMGRERYGMTWPGKADCFKTIQTPSMGTLLPVPDESIKFDTSENLIIEGENLEVLKLLQKAYLGKVKFIYIDPPYNTGSDFIYPDDYTESLKSYLEYTGQADSTGKKFGTNTDTDGRFHSRWMNMMYPRLYLARTLLREDGFIFISIDQNELDNLRKMCNEIFGEDNFRNEIILRRGAKSVQAQFDTWDKLGISYERVLFYSKSSEFRFPKQLRMLDEARNGSWNNHWRGTDRPTMRYELFGITPTSGQWRWGKERSHNAVENYQKLLQDLGVTPENITQEQIDNYYQKKLDAGEDLDFVRLSPSGKPEHYVSPTETTLLNDNWFDLPTSSSKELSTLFGKTKVFDNPKPTGLIQRILDFGDKEDLILDFFAGAGTTAHAVLNKNKEDGGKRKFILVQLPEPTRTKKEDGAWAETPAWKEGFSTIAEITKERVRRVIQKLDEEESNPSQMDEKQDRGFRVFKLAESNFKSWDATTPKDSADLVKQLETHIDHIREGRTSEDILYEILLKSGFPLTTPVELLSLRGGALPPKQSPKNEETASAAPRNNTVKVYSVASGDMLIYLEKDITLESIRVIADLKPRRVICLDSGFAEDQVKANAVQIFRTKDIVFKTV